MLTAHFVWNSLSWLLCYLLIITTQCSDHNCIFNMLLYYRLYQDNSTITVLQFHTYCDNNATFPLFFLLVLPDGHMDIAKLEIRLRSISLMLNIYHMNKNFTKYSIKTNIQTLSFIPKASLSYFAKFSSNQITF